jgi:hypothetical protein
MILPLVLYADWFVELFWSSEFEAARMLVPPK